MPALALGHATGIGPVGPGEALGRGVEHDPDGGAKQRHGHARQPPAGHGLRHTKGQHGDTGAEVDARDKCGGTAPKHAGQEGQRGRHPRPRCARKREHGHRPRPCSADGDGQR